MAFKEGNFNEVIQGTWTPEIGETGSASSITYTTQLGKYTRIGNLVIATATIVINTITPGTGTATFSVPITSDSDGMSQYSQAITSGMAFNATTQNNVFEVQPNTGFGILRVNRDNAASNTVGIVRFANGDSINYTAIYWI